MPTFKKPLRMCVVCRGRFLQKTLLRLQCIDGALSLFSGIKRSFYLCETCLKDSKKINKVFSKQCKKSNDWSSKLNEIRSM